MQHIYACLALRYRKVAYQHAIYGTTDASNTQTQRPKIIKQTRDSYFSQVKFLPTFRLFQN